MFSFPTLKKNKIFAFFIGMLSVVVLIPGLGVLKSHFLASSNDKIEKLQIVALSAVNSASPLGIGLNGIRDWSTEFPFLDLFKSSRRWLPQCVKNDPGCTGKWETGEYDLLDLDAYGWVKSLPPPEATPQYTRVRSIVSSVKLPAGEYIVLYDGEGTIEYQYSAKKDKDASTSGREVIYLPPDNQGLQLIITATDPNKNGNYIRNIRIVKAENEKALLSGEIFNPIFLQKIQKFRAVRFMDWMGTNNSHQVEWSDRPLPQLATYGRKGSPIEIIIALSNKLKADAWVNIPHQANDEYIRNFAKLVKDGLDPDLKVYVEFSNEVWNWQFKQSRYALNQGQEKWGKKGDAHLQWYGMRTAQMCDSWKEVFGNEKNRMVCVISTQTAWKGAEKSVLDCSAWVAEGNKPCYQHADAYAITGYFSGNLGNRKNASKVEAWMAESDGGFAKAFQQLMTGEYFEGKGGIKQVYDNFVYHAGVAKQKGLQLVVYEGGQHIVGSNGIENNQKLTNFFIELNRHPKIYEAYTQLLNNWKQAGGTVFMHFVDASNPGKWGSWGALESIYQNGSPKYNALIDFIDNNRCWWEGCIKTQQ